MMKKLIVCMFGFVCISLAGCVLEDIEEHGDICPPGKLKDSRDGRHVVFSNMDCYQDYILLSPDMADFAGTCGECSELEDGSGKWICNGVLTSCLDNDYEFLKQNYEHCEHYRDHGVLAEGSNVQLGISFVRDYFDADAPLNLSDLSNSCPKDYEVCKYDPKYLNESDENSIPGGYGCYQSCTGKLLYCGGGNLRHCVNPETDSEYCGAQGDCSNPNQDSPNWVGMICENGMICQDGKCVCGAGYKVCEKAAGCVDILHSSEHCGESCEVCGSNGSKEVCMNGTCVPYECEEPGLCSNDRHHCKNTDEACGESCIDCLLLPNVEDAGCDNDGMCIIRTCKENFHPEFNEMTHTYECRKNTIEHCAPRDMNDNEEVQNCTEIPHSSEVACSAEGKCIVKGCADGFSVSSGQTQCVTAECAGCDEDTEICFMGTCQCKPGWVSCGDNGGNCTDIINDSFNCGQCGKVCLFDGEAEHALDFGCNHAKCGVTACESHYHPNDMECELNTPENCGAHGKDCSKIAHVVEATCNEEVGSCIITSCEPKSHIYEAKEICEEDTDKDCGEHEHTCWVEHAVDVECRWNEEELFAYCVTKECEEGYHLTDDSENPDGPQICEKDDEKNCGEHGKECQANAYCVKKEEGYVCECDPAYTDCGGVCINDFDINKEHCGACGNACQGYQDCVTGTCGCASGTDCGSKCADFQTDREHCGGCGNACQSYQDCVSGKCGCASGTDCGSKCADFQTDREHCGGCGNACQGYQDCVSGICGCASGTDCGSKCADLQKDKEHCGACGNKCKDYQTCISGKCGCTSGTDCGSGCVDLQTDKNNCGSCGNKCKDYQTCISGKCGCTSGTDCGSGCVDLQTEKNNCGSCGNKCKDYQTCISGKCGCTSGTDCGSGCVNVSADKSNCGSCGNKCKDYQACVSGSCGCSSGRDCGSSCVSSFTNNDSHCGACNNACTNGKTCQGSSCACPGSTLYCGRSCVGAVIKGAPKVNEFLPIREGPSKPDEYGYAQIYLGNPVYIYGIASENSNWYRVDPGQGYADSEYVWLCKGYGTVHTEKDPNINLWPSVGASSGSLVKIPTGTTYLCLQDTATNGWYKAAYKKKQGFVNGKYVTVTTQLSDNPSLQKCD